LREPDEGNLHVRFDEGRVSRVRVNIAHSPTLPGDNSESGEERKFVLGAINNVDHVTSIPIIQNPKSKIQNWSGHGW
jgi:hypothetical protein